MNFKKTVLLGALLGTFFVGCERDFIDPVEDKQNLTKTTVSNSINTSSILTQKTFTDVYSVLKTACLSCHGSSGVFTLGTSASALSESEAYNNIANFIDTSSSAENSILLQKASGGLSHGGSTVFTSSSSDYILVAAWIDAGLPSGTTIFGSTESNTTQEASARPGYDIPSAPALSFTKKHKEDFSPVQGKACIVCHREEEGKDIVSIGGTLSSFINTENGKYYQDLTGYSVNIVGEDGLNITMHPKSASSEIGHNNFYTKSEDLPSSEKFTVLIKDENSTTFNQSGSNTHSTRTHRDCNSCHGEVGLNGAPGRVLVPLVN